jgi:hypothetical protein
MAPSPSNLIPTAEIPDSPLSLGVPVCPDLRFCLARDAVRETLAQSSGFGLPGVTDPLGKIGTRHHPHRAMHCAPQFGWCVADW